MSAVPSQGHRAWLNSLFVDHALLRLGWRNWGVVESGRLYRSNHPLPWQLRAAVHSEGAARSEEEMGDLLFSIANLSRKLGIDPESALRKANEKFTKRFTALEDSLHSRGRSVHEATLEEMEAEWQLVKGTRLD